MKKLITLFIFIYTANPLFSQDNYPRPTAKDMLFYIQHNRGKNAFFYQANFSSLGILNAKNPVIVRRQLFDENGEIKPLTSVQRKFAYGVHTKEIDHNVYELTLVSYPEQKLILRVGKNHNAFVETYAEGKYMKVERLFIHQKEGTSGLGTKVDYITFHGYDKSNNPIHVRLDPNR